MPRHRDQTDKPLDVYPSVAALSGATGIPASLLKQAKADGCPAFSHSSRVALLPLLRWIFSRGGSTDARLNWKDELSKWKAESAKLKFRKDSGELMPRADAEQTIMMIIDSVRATLKQKMTNEWPVKLAAMSAEEIAAALDKEVDPIYQAMRYGVKEDE